MVHLGKSLWNLVGKGIARNLYNYYKPEKSLSREDRVARLVWLETVVDHLAPDNTDSSILSVGSDFQRVKPHFSAPKPDVSKSPETSMTVTKPDVPTDSPSTFDWLIGSIFG